MINDTTHACVRSWIEFRTKSGRWSRVRHGEVYMQYTPHQLRNFFSAKFPGERREHSYSEHGYLPCRVTVPSPYGRERRVYEFDYYTGPREVIHYTYEY
nr:MAG TPA: hypothetical protein [Caudoviricetes sp.]